jgi:lysophospholipid acyltransferase 7
MMSYLLFFRSLSWFNLPTPSGHTNMIQMILTLKIIGVAFERDSVNTKSKENDMEKSELTPVEVAIKKIGIVDLFHYCFNYIGLLTGEIISLTFFSFS